MRSAAESAGFTPGNFFRRRKSFRHETDAPDMKLIGSLASPFARKVRIVALETGLTDQVLDDPREPYTQLLVSSILPA